MRTGRGSAAQGSPLERGRSFVRLACPYLFWSAVPTMTDIDTELAEVQARKRELERQQNHLRERIKNLRAKESRIRSREGRDTRESADSAIRRAFDRLEPDEPDGYPRGNVLETAVQMAPHHEEADIEDALAGLERRGEVYAPTEGYLRET